MAASARKRKPASFPTDTQVKRVVAVLASSGIIVKGAEVLRDRVLLKTSDGGEASVPNPWDKPARRPSLLTA